MCIRPILRVNFLCFPTAPADPVESYVGACGKHREEEQDFRVDHDATETACQTFKGTNCQLGCVIYGRESVEARTWSGFQEACKEGGTDAIVDEFKTEAEAKEDAQCDKPH